MPGAAMRWYDSKVNKAMEDNSMLWTIVGILVILWLLGFIAHIGGALIHLILVVAAIVFIYNLVTRGRKRV